MLHRAKHAFTLIELLLVVAILAVVTAIIMPNIAGMGGVRVRIGVQDTIQMARFAHNMAILHQVPIDLSFDATGAIRVTPQAKTKIAPLATATTLSLSEDPTTDLTLPDDPPATPKPSATPHKEAGVDAGELDEIATTRQNEGIIFKFLEFTDTPTTRNAITRQTGFTRSTPSSKTEEDPLNEPDLTQTEGDSFTVTFRTNGSCRPFRMQVIEPDGGKTVTIDFDFLGTGTVEAHK